MQNQPNPPEPDQLPESAPPPPPLQAPETAFGSAKEERNMAVLSHLLGLTWLVSIPGFIGPLILWFVKKDGQPFASAQIKESLNFQLSITLYMIICGALFFLIIPLFLIPVIGLFAVIVAIIAAIQSKEGVDYRYPLTIRLIN